MCSQACHIWPAGPQAHLALYRQVGSGPGGGAPGAGGGEALDGAVAPCLLQGSPLGPWLVAGSGPRTGLPDPQVPCHRVGLATLLGLGAWERPLPSLARVGA